MINEIEVLARSKEEGERQIKEWEDAGFPVPPPHIVKENTVRHFQNEYNCNTFIETGTYLGDMIEGVKNDFTTIYSIEVSEPLYQFSKDRFKNESNIQIYHGDSGSCLESILQRVNESVVFWLDAHYSGGITSIGAKGCPIYEELSVIIEHIVKNKIGHIILIDDTRCFVGDALFPSVDDIEAFLNKSKLRFKLYIKNDIMRINFIV